MVKVCVLGAGIIGLSSASHIQDAFPEVALTVIAEKFSPFTTSDVSSSCWMPSMNGAGSKFDEWAGKTYDFMFSMALSSQAGEVGAQIISGYKLYGKDKNFSLGHLVKGLRPLSAYELDLYPHRSTIRKGISFLSATLECQMYLPWLSKKLIHNGATIIQKRIDSIHEVTEIYDIVVNCTGLGSYHLLSDHSLQPIRGHVFKVKAPWIKSFFSRTGEDFDCYILPAVNEITIGGTYQRDDWDTRVRVADSKKVWEDCEKYFPFIKGATILKTVAGLRPFRPVTRLERDNFRSKSRICPIIHNYGHGGAGITLFKGCAEEVTELVRTCIDEIKLQISKL